MVKFLLQHALALDDKELEEDIDGLSSWPLSILDSHVEPTHVDKGLMERSRVTKGIIEDMRMRTQ